jgi:signal transduction histidine kinase
MVPAELPELATELDRVADELNGVVEDLRQIARGIHPVILSQGGLGPALRTLARDDGVGGADPLRGSGLVGLQDRIEALGGTFSLHGPAGGGTTVRCELPVPARAEHPDAGAGD